MGWLFDFYRILLERRERRRARQREEIKGRVIAALERVVALRDSAIAETLEVSPSELTPALQELEREGLLFYDPTLKMYSRQPLPWRDPKIY